MIQSDEDEVDEKVMENITRLINQDKIKEFQISNGKYLRLLEKGQESALFDAIIKNKSFLLDSMPWVPHYNSIQDAVDFIHFIEQCHADTTKLTYTIWNEKTIIGSIAFQTIDLGLLMGEIGYWLDSQFNGQGIMTNCCTKLLEIGFIQYELRQVVIKCQKSNIKSAAIPLRLGFQEGETETGFEINGKIEDQRSFKLSKEQYFDRKQSQNEK